MVADFTFRISVHMFLRGYPASTSKLVKMVVRKPYSMHRDFCVSGRRVGRRPTPNFEEAL